MSDKRHSMNEENSMKKGREGEARDRSQQKKLSEYGGQDAARHIGDRAHHGSKKGSPKTEGGDACCSINPEK